jgi:hypothetical protein
LYCDVLREAALGALRFSGLNAADLAAVAEGNLTRLVAEAARRLNAREDEA